jgi:hypothetical protein
MCKNLSQHYSAAFLSAFVVVFWVVFYLVHFPRSITSSTPDDLPMTVGYMEEEQESQQPMSPHFVVSDDGESPKKSPKKRKKSFVSDDGESPKKSPKKRKKSFVSDDGESPKKTPNKRKESPKKQRFVIKVALLSENWFLQDVEIAPLKLYFLIFKKKN